MRIVVRRSLGATLLGSATLASLFILGMAGTAAADNAKKDKSGSTVIASGVMFARVPSAEHLAQAGRSRKRTANTPAGMDMGVGMMGPGGGPGMPVGMGMEGGMVMGGGMLGMRGASRATKNPQKDFADLPINQALTIAISSKADNKDLPPVENLVERTMAINPEVVAARAELQRAQANLERIQLEVARNVIEIRARWEVARRNVQRLEAKVNSDRENAEVARAYINARAELSQIERELPLLSGSIVFNPGSHAIISSVGTYTGHVKKTTGSVVSVVGTTSLPSSATSVAEPKMPKEFDKPVTINFSDTEMQDVAQYLQETTKVQFVIDRESIVGQEGDITVTISLKDIPLKDALQAIEDTSWPVRFIVRPYGILVTDEDNAITRFGAKPERASRNLGAFGRGGFGGR